MRCPLARCRNNHVHCIGAGHSFDPTADVRKKKKTPNSRPTSVPVVMMKRFSSAVPKGKFRQKLISSGQIQTMRVTKEMSSSEVRNKIQKAFGVSDYTVLECGGNSHDLLKSSEQDVNGEYVAQRRGSLYLCENFEVKTLSLLLMLLLRFCNRVIVIQFLRVKCPR